MYNYSITYQDTTQPNVVFKQSNIDAYNMNDCFIAFNKLHPTGFIHSIKLNEPIIIMKTDLQKFVEILENKIFHQEAHTELQTVHKLGLKEAWFLAKEILQKENTTNEDSIFPPISELTLKEDLDKFPNSLFCFHGDTFILELKIRDNELIAWVNYTKIWNPISIKHDWNYDQTQFFLKEKIEEYFKLIDVTPSFRLWMWTTLIEEHFKLRDVTPQSK